jgi:hypothetical protein
MCKAIVALSHGRTSISMSGFVCEDVYPNDSQSGHAASNRDAVGQRLTPLTHCFRGDCFRRRNFSVAAGFALYMQTLNRKSGLTAKLGMLASTALAFGFAAQVARADDHPRVEEVNGRYRNQQERIANGVGSGALNAKETSRLEGREAALKATERQDRLNHNGHLTRQEQANLNHRENRISRSIYHDKHN